MALTQISTAGVKDDAVTSGKIPANAVGSSELADNAVDTAAIADQAVTLDKLPHGTSSNNGKFLRANNGADPTFETVTSTTINSNANNRVITGSDSANNLNGEANLFFDGSQLGVGTTSPYQYSIAHFESTNGIVLAGSSQSRLLFRHTGGGTDLKMTDIQSSNGKMKFRSLADNTSATTRMVIDDAGKIGIGTPSPDTKLDVARLGSAWTGEDPAAGTVAHFHNGNNGSTSPAYLALGGGTASASGINFGDADDNDVGRLIYSHGDNALKFTTNAAERMRITSDGKVGIGTTSPVYKLHLNESTSGSNYITFTNSSTGTSATDGGQVGIDGLERLIVWQAENNDIRFATNNTERMRILAGGGLTFNGDDTAANALDDYEEGNWTPSINGLSVANLAGTGRYVKVGRMVTIVCYINIGTHTYDGGSSTTPLQINGLPFQCGGGGTGWYGAAIGNIQRLDGGNSTQSTNRQFAMNVGPGYQALYGRWIQFGNNAFANSTLGDLYDSFAIHVSCTYRTT